MTVLYDLDVPFNTHLEILRDRTRRAELAEDPVAEDLRAMFAPFGTRFPAVSRDISLLATHPAA